MTYTQYCNVKYRKRDTGLSFTGRVFLALKVKEAGEVERILICPVKLRDTIRTEKSNR